MLDVARLRVLRAVVADGSIHGAAASLGYSPSAISQQISALQKATGLTLVERSGRGIEPTPAARQLATRSGRVFEALAEVDELVADLRAGREGTLTISYFASAGAAWIPPVVAAVTREFPRLRLDLRLSELQQEDGWRPDVEIVVEGSGPPAADRQGWVTHPLLEDPYLVVVPRDDALAGSDRVRLRDLAGAAWIDNDASQGPCRQITLDACAAAGFTPTFRVETQDYGSAIQFVAQGLGITVVPRLGLGTLPDGVVALRVVDPVPLRRIALRLHPAVAHHPAVRRLVGLLRAQVALERQPRSALPA